MIQLSVICLRHSSTCEEKARAAKERTPKKRFMWKDYINSVPDKHFRRTFRMSKGCFMELCKRIRNAVGEDTFKSEEYITTFQEKDVTSINYKKRRMAHARAFTSGECICGEVKLAVTLRLLAGGSYLDIAALYCSGYTYSYQIFHDVIRNWICNDKVLRFDGLDYFDNMTKMREEARKFQACGTHGGIFSGVIGALDGWLVKIRRPKSNDGAGHIGSYFSRKGFYAINVQAIVTKDKRIIWRSIKCKGSEHDSTAFKKSALHQKLIEKFNDLLDNGLYLVGDSAYAIKSFLLTPFDNATPKSAKDSFNYHHSTCRIWVECAFGEIDMRWGILWRPLQFDLDKNILVIDAVMRLHNYLVENRERNENNDIEDFRIYEQETIAFMQENPFEHVGVFNGHEEDQESGHDGVGRSLRIMESSTREGKRLREYICDTLERHGKVRPLYSARWRKDKFNRTRQP